MLPLYLAASCPKNATPSIAGQDMTATFSWFIGDFDFHTLLGAIQILWTNGKKEFNEKIRSPVNLQKICYHRFKNEDILASREDSNNWRAKLLESNVGIRPNWPF